MALFVAWIMLGIEFIVASLFGVILWRAWSRSAMNKIVAFTAIAIYAFCCACCLMLTFFVPL